MSNNLFFIILLALLVYLLLGGNSTTPTTQGSGAGCVQAYQQEFGPRWAEMSTLERAIVGLRAASCEGGQ